jgi:glycosyltransferase involved in cell wall biosynthesis
MFSRAEGSPLALVEAMLCGRPAIVSDVGGNQEWVTESQTGFVAEAPVVGLARTALERAWSARQSWHAMGLLAHNFATGRISDAGIPSLLEVILEACQHRRSAAEATGDELKRLKRYRWLMKPTIGRQAKRVAEAGALLLREIVLRWRAARERSLLQLAEPTKPD